MSDAERGDVGDAHQYHLLQAAAIKKLVRTQQLEYFIATHGPGPINPLLVLTQEEIDEIRREGSKAASRPPER